VENLAFPGIMGGYKSERKSADALEERKATIYRAPTVRPYNAGARIGAKTTK
jgi:hypothetical protein